MSEFFDELARTLAKPMPRSRAIRVLGVALASTAVPLLRARPAAALSSRELSTSCHTAKAQCDRQGLMLCKCNERPANLIPPETTICNFLCCDGERYKCICRPGEAICTPKPCSRKCRDECCKSDEYCASHTTGTCCKKGETLCGTSCCQVNEECVRSLKPSIAACVPRCPPGRARCGEGKCCPPKWHCIDPARGICRRCRAGEEECDKRCCDRKTSRCCGNAGCCPKDRSCCVTGKKQVCCPPRQKCAVPILPGNIGVKPGTDAICCPPERLNNDPKLCCPAGQVALNSPGLRTPPPGVSPFCCPRGRVCRSRDSGNDVCVDFQSDPSNCGSCGNVCASGICSGGVCALP